MNRTEETETAFELVEQHERGVDMGILHGFGSLCLDALVWNRPLDDALLGARVPRGFFRGGPPFRGERLHLVAADSEEPAILL